MANTFFDDMTEAETKLLTDMVGSHVEQLTSEGSVHSLYDLATLLRKMGDHELAKRVEESVVEARHRYDCKHCGQPGGH